MSLSVLLGAVGVWLGYALADPIVGLVITAVIVRIVCQSGKAVFTRLLDGIDPEVIDEIAHAVHRTSGVCDVSKVRVRWLGHRLHAEVNVAVRADLSVEQGHDIAKEVRHNLLHGLRYLSHATIILTRPRLLAKRTMPLPTTLMINGLSIRIKDWSHGTR